MASLTAGLFGLLIFLLWADKRDRLNRRRRQLDRLYRADAANRR